MGSVKEADKKDFDIKQLFLNNVQMQQLCRLKTLHKINVLIQCTTKIYTAWFGLFYEEQCTAGAPHLQLNYAKMQIFQQVSQIESTLLCWLISSIKFLYYHQLFLKKFVKFCFCNLASLTVFLGDLYILPSHKMPAYPTSTFLIAIFYSCGTCNQSTMRGVMLIFSKLLP